MWSPMAPSDSGLSILGIIIVTAMVNLLIGSASVKWALLAPIFADPEAGRTGMPR
jgi:p-aminobenzoyl-glutamate transporter AbgT